MGQALLRASQLRFATALRFGAPIFNFRSPIDFYLYLYIACTGYCHDGNCPTHANKRPSPGGVGRVGRTAPHCDDRSRLRWR